MVCGTLLSLLLLGFGLLASPKREGVVLLLIALASAAPNVLVVWFTVSTRTWHLPAGPEPSSNVLDEVPQLNAPRPAKPLTLAHYVLGLLAAVAGLVVLGFACVFIVDELASYWHYKGRYNYLGIGLLVVAGIGVYCVLGIAYIGKTLLMDRKQKRLPVTNMPPAAKLP